MYPVFLSDDEQAKAAAAAEANKPKPLVIDPELDIHRAVNVGTVTEWESQGTEGQDLGAGEGNVVVFNRDRAEQAADECGNPEPCEEGVDVAHCAESRRLAEDTDGKPSKFLAPFPISITEGNHTERAKKGESLGEQSSARVTRSQPTPGSNTPGPSTKPGAGSNKSPKKTKSEGFKAKNPVAKKARIKAPQPETSRRKSSNASQEPRQSRQSILQTILLQQHQCQEEHDEPPQRSSCKCARNPHAVSVRFIFFK